MGITGILVVVAVVVVVVVVVDVVVDEVLAAFHFPSSSGKTVIVRNLLTYHSRYYTAFG